MKIVGEAQYKKLSQHAARIVLMHIRTTPRCTLGLATGSTPEGLYQELARAYKAKRVDFSKVTTFNLDEYIGLSPEHPQSYHWYMEKLFFSKVNVKKEHIFIPSHTGRGVQQYEREIKRRGGIDLQILGIGQNGHIGFNEPGSSFHSRTRIVRLTEKTRKDNARFFFRPSHVPKHAVTMGLATIMDARSILLLASGKKKKRALHNALSGPVTPRVPASILQRHSSLTVLYDRRIV